MTRKSPIELVLLDFDGTLIDTAPDIIRSINLFLKSHGQRELGVEDIRKEIGFGLKNLIRRTFPEAMSNPARLAEMENQFLKIYDQEHLREPAPFPGVVEFLNSWPGQIAIVSNKRVRYINTIMKHLKFDVIRQWTSVIGGDSFPEMKPHPRPFLEAMKNAGIDRAKTVMVGDGAPDIEGARAVGIHSVAVSFGYSPLEELVRLGANSTIDSFFELTEILNNFG